MGIPAFTPSQRYGVLPPCCISLEPPSCCDIPAVKTVSMAAVHGPRSSCIRQGARPSVRPLSGQVLLTIHLHEAERTPRKTVFAKAPMSDRLAALIANCRNLHLRSEPWSPPNQPCAGRRLSMTRLARRRWLQHNVRQHLYLTSRNRCCLLVGWSWECWLAPDALKFRQLQASAPVRGPAADEVHLPVTSEARGSEVGQRCFTTSCPPSTLTRR